MKMKIIIIHYLRIVRRFPETKNNALHLQRSSRQTRQKLPHDESKMIDFGKIKVRSVLIFCHDCFRHLHYHHCHQVDSLLAL